MNDSIVQSATNNTLGKSVHLDGIAKDVQHLIAAELAQTSKSSVFALGQSSQTLRQATLPFIYRDIVLVKDEENDSSTKAYEALVDQFRVEGEYTVARYVRSIVVKDGASMNDLLMILDKISECGTLRKMSWETSTHIAPPVLDKLHTTWPELELSVCVLNRVHARHVRHRQMDEQLLSSPLLKSLTYNVILGGGSENYPARSEWPKLTRAIVAGGNLCILKIQSQSDGSKYSDGQVLSDTEPEMLMRLDIEHGTRLPALEEFTLHDVRCYGRSTYLWDAEHCELLRKAMDWSKLRTLDFASDMPTGFFAAFTGRLPGLEKLRFRISRDDMSGLPVVSEFIKSVNGLESLDINQPQYVADAKAALPALWPAITHHRDTLKELIVRQNFALPEEFSRLEEIATSFPLLKRFGWNLARLPDAKAEYFKPILRMNLEKLDLSLSLPWEANDYSAEQIQDISGSTSPSLNKETSQRAAVMLMNDISAAQSQPLDRLTLHISRVGAYDRAQSYRMYAKLQVRRSKGKGPGGSDVIEFRGKQRWAGMEDLEMGDLEEDLSLTED